MELDKKEIDIILNALNTWEQEQHLSREQADRLRATVHPRKAGVQIAQYFFIIAIACTLLAFGAIFIDDKFLEKIKLYFDVGNIIIAVACTIIAILWFIYMARKKPSFTHLMFEVYMVLGGLVTICAITYYCKDLGVGPNYSGFLIITALVMLALSTYFRSYTLWIAGLLAFMGWYGTFSQWQQNTDNLFLGMNYPMRFTVFGLFVIGLSFLQTKIQIWRFTQRHTYVIGLLILFTGLWGISVFGNYGHYDEWQAVRQVQVIGYSIVFAMFGVAALLLGIKYRDDLTRDIGIIFILINLYSRYFEFFWNTTNKGIFFLILAVSFGLVGWQIEKRLKRQKTEGL